MKEKLERGEIGPDTRVIFIHLWSDDFEARQISGNSKLNSLSYYTIRVRGEKDIILPFALAFKKLSDMDPGSSILIDLLKEVKQLEEPHMVYYGEEKAACSTMAFCELISQDYPKCCDIGILKIPGVFCR